MLKNRAVVTVVAATAVVDDDVAAVAVDDAAAILDVGLFTFCAWSAILILSFADSIFNFRCIPAFGRISERRRLLLGVTVLRARPRIPPIFCDGNFGIRRF